MEYFYNSDGYLTRLNVYETDEETGEYTTNCSMTYIWDGDRLVSRSFPADDGKALNSRVLYDTDGESYGFEVSVVSEEQSADGIVFLYRKNLQGDITGIISPNGELMGEFTYDAYGNLEAHPIDNTLGGVVKIIIAIMLSPQLYRGYAYTIVGEQMGYYLGSRYYIPIFGRFLSADIYADTGMGVVGSNMYAYCLNNPINYIDPLGQSAATILASILGIGALPVGATTAYVVAYNTMLCVRLFQWSFTHKTNDAHYEFSSSSIGNKNWSSFIASKLKKSQVIKSEVAKIIAKMGTSNRYKQVYNGSNGGISFYNNGSYSSWKTTDNDLSWSIGSLAEKAIFSIQVVKTGTKRYKVYCTLVNELWDFSNANNYSGLNYYLVSLGICLHESKKVTSNYYWGFSVAFTMTM